MKLYINILLRNFKKKILNTSYYNLFNNLFCLLNKY